MACAASPNNSTSPFRCQPRVYTVPSEPCGCSKNSRVRSGISARADGNSRAKNASTAAGRLSCSKLFAPCRARNSVAVNVPSRLGSAISMNPPRGQMCSAFGSMHVLAIARRNGEFLVVVIQRLFAHRRDFARHQRIAHRGAGAVGGDRRLRGACDRSGRWPHRATRARLCSCARPRHSCPKWNSTFGNSPAASIERAIQLRARHGIDDLLGPHAIHLQLGGAIVLMHHAAAHRDGQRHDAFEHAGELQSADAARGEGEIDGAAAVDSRRSADPAAARTRSP